MKPSTRHGILLVVIVPVLFSSCIGSSYFHHPMEGNTNAYHVMPVASDSVTSATYVSGAASIGSMNDNLRDMVYAFQGGLHEAHAFGPLRMNYGGSVDVGVYNVKSYQPYYNYSPQPPQQIGGGSRFFGTYNFYGALGAATRLGRRGEWRVLGVEGGISNEFGDYYSFRKSLPDSVVTEIDRNRSLGNIGGYTELVFKYRSGRKFGVKFAAGSYLRRLYRTDYSQTNFRSYDDLFYLSNTYHFTSDRTTVYFQFNIANEAVHFQLGTNFRIF